MRGGETLHKVVLKPQESDETFIVFVDSKEDLDKWRKDPDATPLAQVVSNFNVHTSKQGAQGKFDKASKGTLENAFGDKSEDNVLKEILKQGTYQEATTRTRDSSTNDTKGSQISHK